MSFGGSNPPWQRNTLANAGQQNALTNLSSQMINANLVGFQNFNQNLTMAQHSNMNTVGSAQANQSNLSILPQLNANIGTLNPNQLFGQTVQYSNARTTVQNVFSSANPQAQQTNHQFQSQQQQQTTCNKIGTVTEIGNQFGVIDDEILFRKHTCKGASPKIGDRVFVDATFCPNSTVKWNATQVQLIPGNSNVSLQNMNIRNVGNNCGILQQQQQQITQQSQQQQQMQNRGLSGYNAVPPPMFGNNFDRSSRSNQSRKSPNTRSPERGSRSSNTSFSRQSRSREDNDDERRRRREKERGDRERERKKEGDKDRQKDKRDQSVEHRDRSPTRRTSPRRKRSRPIPRYAVQMPQIALNINEADVLELRRRYNNLYVPSEFFNSNIRWPESFPPNAPFSLHQPCTFHVFHKSVTPITTNDADAAPPDADNTFSAKVMLMEIPPMNEVYKKCFASADEKNTDDYIHPSRLISFLVGIFGKNETMAIGGNWSPSLDGPNPQGDPTVLIRTAIRTCKALTGIDLSSCTQWYRFVELHYRRNGRNDSIRTQTVVIFLPDVRSCLPTRVEWDELNTKYKHQLKSISSGKSSSADSSNNPVDDNHNDGSNDTQENEIKTEQENINDDNSKPEINDENAAEKTEEDLNTDDPSSDTNEKDTKENTSSIKSDATNHTELDVKAMKMNELRGELESRNLSSKGLKPQLVARLSKALRHEQSEDVDNEADPQDAGTEDIINENDFDMPLDENANSTDGVDIDMNDIVVIDEYDSTKNDSKTDESRRKENSKLEERERRYLEKRYRLPEMPHIIVHPIQTRSFVKFTCEVRSLSILLDYRPEDMKKNCFEVSLFAELFNEMLMRDFGYDIFKALNALAAQEANEQKEKEKRENDNKTGSEEPKEKRQRKDENDDNSNTNQLVEKTNENATTKQTTETENDSKTGRDRRERRTSRRDDDSDNESPKKMITVHPDLLLSFVYFDQTHCGYIFGNHIEELFFALGLRLSRAETRKIVPKRNLFYRKITDKPKDEVKFENNDKTTKTDVIEKTLALEQFVTDIKLNNNADENVSQVIYKGAVIDIEKLLHQIQRSEKAREEIELRLIEITRNNQELQTNSTKASDKIKELQSDLKNCNRKLSDALATLSSSSKKCTEFYSILASVYDKVGLVIKSDKNSSSSKDREKDSKRDKDSSKDKDKEKDKERNHLSKEKEKDKDKDKETIKVESKNEIDE